MPKETSESSMERKPAATYESDREIILEEIVTLQKKVDTNFDLLREILGNPEFAPVWAEDEAAKQVIDEIKETILLLQRQIEILRGELRLLRQTSGPVGKENTDREAPLVN